MISFLEISKHFISFINIYIHSFKMKFSLFFYYNVYQLLDLEDIMIMQKSKLFLNNWKKIKEKQTSKLKKVYSEIF